MQTVERDEFALGKQRNLRLSAEQDERIARVADTRMTSEAATMRWLLDRALDWWDSLSRDERAAR